MGTFRETTKRILLSSGRTFRSFPVVMGNAALMTIVAIVKIAVDWTILQPYDFLISCVQLALAVGAAFGLAAITFGQSRLQTKRSFVLANLLGILVTMVAFLLMYFVGGREGTPYPGATTTGLFLSNITQARAAVFIFLCFLAFLLVAAKTEDSFDFASAVFMSMKAFFIALLYGLVVFGGTAAIFGAVRALLYAELSFKILGYLGALSVFFAFAIYIGYFPDFRLGSKDPQREVAQKQPRFITVLFEYILIPIFLALTLVLLLWALRTVIVGVDLPFLNLYSIATGYAVGGLLLHILVTHGTSPTAKFYRKVFPATVLLILLFELWALVISIRQHGLQTEEYVFLVIWLVTLVSAILLLFKQAKAHRPMVYVVAILSVIAVLPVVGFHQLPYNQQLNRLETLLQAENMLQNEKIVPAAEPPALATREAITNAVDFLIYSDNPTAPTWLDKDALRRGSFRQIFGFDKTYPGQTEPGGQDMKYTSLQIRPRAIDISAYQWEIAALSSYDKTLEPIQFTGAKGAYIFTWSQDSDTTLPLLTVNLNGRVIMRQDFRTFVDLVLEKFPLGAQTFAPPTEADLTFEVETAEIQLTFIFRSVYVSYTTSTGEWSYTLEPLAVYMNEK